MRKKKITTREEEKEVYFCDGCNNEIESILTCWGCDKDYCEVCFEKETTRLAEFISLCKECMKNSTLKIAIISYQRANDESEKWIEEARKARQGK